MAPADIAAHVQRRVKRIAEQAFWDAVQSSLAQSGGDGKQQKVTGQLAGLLAHLGQELLAVLPEQAGAAREQLAAELAEDRLQEALTAHQVGGLGWAVPCSAGLCRALPCSAVLCCADCATHAYYNEHC